MPETEYLYYCVVFEYMLSSYDSEAIELMYNFLKKGVSAFHLKRVREDFVSGELG